MDPDDLAAINQWLAGMNPQGGYQPPTASQPSAAMGQNGQTDQQVYWPDTWTDPNAKPTPQDYADAIEALFGPSTGQDGQANTLPVSYHGPATLGSQLASATGAYAPPSSQAANSSSLGMSASGPRQSGPSGPQPLSNSASSLGLPLPPSFYPTSSQPPSKQLQDAANRELLARGVNPNADDYPSENDALVNLARGRAAPSWDPMPALNVSATPAASSASSAAPPIPGQVGPHGYQPAPGDDKTLARMIYAEGLSTPDDFPAIGWTIVNRIGNRQYRPTLNGVLYQPKQYAIVEAGGGPPGGSPQWQESGDPSKLTGVKAARWQQALQASQGILSGAISDPTGGAQYFFASPDLDGNAAKAAPPVSPYFTYRFTHGTLRQSQYQGHVGVGNDKGTLKRNYFAIDSQNPPVIYSP